MKEKQEPNWAAIMMVITIMGILVAILIPFVSGYNYNTRIIEKIADGKMLGEKDKNLFQKNFDSIIERMSFAELVVAKMNYPDLFGGEGEEEVFPDPNIRETLLLVLSVQYRRLDREKKLLQEMELKDVVGAVAEIETEKKLIVEEIRKLEGLY